MAKSPELMKMQESISDAHKNLKIDNECYICRKSGSRKFSESQTDLISMILKIFDAFKNKAGFSFRQGKDAVHSYYILEALGHDILSFEERNPSWLNENSFMYQMFLYSDKLKLIDEDTSNYTKEIMLKEDWVCNCDMPDMRKISDILISSAKEIKKYKAI